MSEEWAKRVGTKISHDLRAGDEGPANNVSVVGRQSYRTPMAVGARWTIGSLLTKQATRLIVSLVLARVLGPMNFGIVGLATLYVSFTGLLLDLGFGAALVQRENVGDKETGSVFWMNSASAVGLVAITIVVAPSAAAFFNTPELTDLLRVLAISVLLKAAVVVPVSMMTREMRFRSLAMVEVAGMVAGGTAGIAAALGGAEYWSIVIQTLVIDTVNAGLLLAVFGIPSFQWSPRAIRQMWSYSTNVVVGQVVGYLYSNTDNVLIGRYLGLEPLAYYSLAYRILLLPWQIFAEGLRRVVFPVLCRLQNANDQMRGHFLEVTQIVSLATYPAMALVAASSPLAVPIIFGEDWSPAVRPIQVLAVASMAQSVDLRALVLLARGRADVNLRITVSIFVLSVVGFTIGLRWGVVGVASAYTVVRFLVWPVGMWYTGRLIDMTVMQYYRTLVPAGFGASIVFIVWTASADAYGNTLGANEWLTLVLSSATAICAYVATLRTLWPKVLHRTIGILMDIAKTRSLGSEQS